MKKNDKLPEKSNGGSEKQMSNQAMLAVIRPHVPMLIARALEIAQSDRQASNRLGAIKLLLGKVLPDLKAESLIDPDGNTYRLLLDVPGLKIVKNAGNTVQSASELPAETTTSV